MHYKALLNQQVKQRKGGHNKINYMLSIKTFKLFCLKAGTSKAEQIHEYYINLEEILHDVIQEESNDFKALKKENIELKEIIHTKETSEERQHNIQFKAIFGTRQEVWDGIAMKTRGMLFKQDLMNKDGVIISRLKHNMSLNNKGFGSKQSL